jgi:hypothetical protein
MERKIRLALAEMYGCSVETVEAMPEFMLQGALIVNQEKLRAILNRMGIEIVDGSVDDYPESIPLNFIQR